MTSYLLVPVKRRVQGAGVESGELRGELFGRAAESGEAVSRVAPRQLRTTLTRTWSTRTDLSRCHSGRKSSFVY